MKCPKCGYISFDYNQVCPKCNKDITAEQERLNIPSFRPDPPFLLAALIGDAGETQTGMEDSGAYPVDEEHEADLSFDDSGAFDSDEVAFDDSGAFDSDEISFDDSQELELDFETKDSGKLERPGESEGISEEESVADFDFDSATDGEEISPDIGEPEADQDTELGLDLENLSGDEPESDEKAFVETTPTEEDGSFDLSDLSLDDAGPAGEMESVDAGEESYEPDIDLEDLSLESDESSNKDLEPGLGDLTLEKGEPDAESGGVDPMSSSELTLDLEGTSLGGELFSDADISEDDSATIDLDDLDLEIEMEDSEQQKST